MIKEAKHNVVRVSVRTQVSRSVDTKKKSRGEQFFNGQQTQERSQTVLRKGPAEGGLVEFPYNMK